MRRLLAFWGERKSFFFIYAFIFTFSILLLQPSSVAEEKVRYLKKVGEIKDGFSSEKENFFIKISSICCDDEGNLYVADSGWNKIFKFDPEGKFLMSFGRQGQGPGEFMAQRLMNQLRISFGNDGKLYVKDPGNSRVSVFTRDGNFIKSYRIPPYSPPYDPPVVNSKGDIFLHSKSRIKVIDCYNSEGKYKFSILDFTTHRESPFDREYANTTGNFPSHEVLSLIAKDDRVVLVSNVSLTVFIFEGEKEIKRFRIKEGNFLKDLKKRVEEIKQREPSFRKEIEAMERKRRSQGYGFRVGKPIITPFLSIFSNDNNYLYLLYVGFGNKSKILKYDMEGNFHERLELHELISGTVANKQLLFGIGGRSTKIIIYKL